MTYQQFMIMVISYLLVLQFGCRQPSSQPMLEDKHQPIIASSSSDLAYLILSDHEQQLKVSQENQQWHMDSPQETSVDRLQMIALWQCLSTLAGQPVAKNEQRVVQGKFDQTKAIMTIVVGLKSGRTEKWQALRGENGTITYMKNEENKQIFRMTSNSNLDLQAWAAKLPNRYLMPFDSSRVERIEFRYDEKVVDLDRSPDQADHSWQLHSPQQRPLSDETVMALLDFIENMVFIEIKERSVWGKKILSRYGFHKPAATIRLWQTGSRNPTILDIGMPKDEPGMVYAKYRDDTKIVSLAQSLLGQLVDQFNQVQIIRKVFTTLKLVQKIECQFPAYQRLLIKQKEQWSARAITADLEGQDLTGHQAEAEAALFLLDQMTYASVIDPGTTLFQDFQAASLFGSLKLYHGVETLLTTANFYRHPKFKSILFVKKEHDDKIMVIDSQQLSPIFIKE